MTINPKLPRGTHCRGVNGGQSETCQQCRRARPTWQAPVARKRCFRTCYLEGQGDWAGRLLVGITRITVWVIGVINLPTKFSGPPSKGLRFKDRVGKFEL